MQFEEGTNCWRSTWFDRAALVVDAGNYYEDLCTTLPRATQSIYILGWDFDSRVRLNRDDGDPLTPFALFSKLIKKHPGLQIYVLIWCSSWVYTVKREILVRWRLPADLKKNVHLIFDTEYPFTSSQHQKIVVIDDHLSYCGGMDITKGRWDLPAHIPNDPRRTTPDGERFTPYHDVMIKMEGDVSRHLGELFRERWKKATRQDLHAPDSSKAISSGDLHWDMQSAPCAVSRTFPPFKDNPLVDETFRMYEQLIAEAKHHIYIENQYLTSAALTEMLCARLREPDGPTITIVIPRRSENGIGNHMLMMHRAVMLRRLRQADRFGHLGLYAPIVGEKVPVYVHSKLMFVDDLYALIGSSNLTDRSMGLDSECDMVIDATGSPESGSTIVRWKRQLLGEHLGLSAEDVEVSVPDWAEVNTWIDSHLKKDRFLKPLWANKLTEWERRVVGWRMADYSQTFHLDTLIDTLRSVFLKEKFPVWRNALVLLGIVLGLLLLAGVILVKTPLRDWLQEVLGSPQFLAIQDTGLGPVWMPVLFAAAGLLCVPMNFLMLATATVFTAKWAFLYIITGMLLSAAVNYVVGRFIGKRFLQKAFSRSFDRISAAIQKRELESFAILRMIPVAPAGIINYVAGAYHAHFIPYIAGTFLGILPGTILLVYFQRTLIQTILNPTVTNALFLLLYSSILWSIALFFRRRL